MQIRFIGVAVAIILASVGLWLECRSRPSQVWSGYCPCCENGIRLPVDTCPYCGANLSREDYRYALEFEHRAFEQRRVERLLWSKILILVAALFLVMAIALGTWG